MFVQMIKHEMLTIQHGLKVHGPAFFEDKTA